MTAAAVESFAAHMDLPVHDEIRELEHGHLRVRGGAIVVLAGNQLPAVGGHLQRMPLVHPQEDDIYHVDAPVARETARVVEEPSEPPMAAVRTVGDVGRWTQPEVPVQLPWRVLGLLPADPGTAARPRPADCDLAHLTGADKVDGIDEVLDAPLPGIDLGDAFETLGRAHHRLTLNNVMGNGLLDEHVLAGLTRVDEGQRMPVVRRADHDGIYLLHIQDAPEVLCKHRLPAVFLIHRSNGLRKVS